VGNAAARINIEALLRARKLDGTLTSNLPLATACDQQRIAPTGLDALDSRLEGGLPRGEVSELVGPRSSGRSSLLYTMLAAAARRGELVALIDVLDTFDPESAASCGIDLARLLWVRGSALSAGPARPSGQLLVRRSATEYEYAGAGLRGADPAAEVRIQAVVDQSIKALNIVLQAGGFGIVALDWAEAPPKAIRRLPFTTWMRLQRVIEDTTTACVLLGTHSVGRSAGGVTIALQARRSPIAPGPGRAAEKADAPHRTRAVPGLWANGSPGARLFMGLEVEAHIVRAARQSTGSPVCLSIGA
jgi:recombination protein RecA